MIFPSIEIVLIPDPELFRLKKEDFKFFFYFFEVRDSSKDIFSLLS